MLPVGAFDPLAPRTTIGRRNCTIELNHPTVSHFHAQIDRLDDGSHILRDVGSTNGTFVNGRRVTQYLLKPGDIIKVGPFKLTYAATHIEQYDQQGAIRIDVHDMNLEVKNRETGKPLVLLNHVSLSIFPREFVALVGGSGAGKSTLMKAISGFTRVPGRVLVNGDDYYRNFDSYRMMLGYVPQQDILHRTLPADRALNYAAQLRLPSDMKRDEIAQRIEMAVEAVEMVPHRKKFIRNMSGGQIKRVSIAAELLAEPTLFFLDEPTSGLDPGLEKKMMQDLRQMADSGRTIVLVTHATENITQCHQVVFMSRGRMIYYGPPAEAKAFFGVPESGSFSDIYTRIDGKADPNIDYVKIKLGREYEEWKRNHPRSREQPTLPELWEAKYKNSAQYQKYVVGRLNQAPPEPVVRADDGKAGKTPRISPLRQYLIQTRRYFDITISDRMNLLILLLQSPIIAGLLWMLTRKETLTGVTDKDMIQRGEAMSLLFVLAAVAVWFGIINSAREITKEQDVFERERMSKLNIFSYLFSKLTVLGVLVFVQNIALLAILALSVDFPLDPGPGGVDPLLAPVWLELFITMMLTAMAGTTLGLLISTFSSTSDQAISIVPLVLIPQILFAGLIFKIQDPWVDDLGTMEQIIRIAIWSISLLMTSRWALDAFGTSFNLNQLCQLPNVEYDGSVQTQCAVSVTMGNSSDQITQGFLKSAPFLERGLEKADVFPNAFEYTTPHLLMTWGGAGRVCRGLFLRSPRSCSVGAGTEVGDE
ncbi:MAG: ATP-binding cassette domain-containing protein, partial [Chloroflexaceae bacterium]|nr:ATP-binding cassette domain-containing protein [Chloroflexaceae bacterium]